MGEQPKDGGPAFPVPGNSLTDTTSGMSLRDYFAAQALIALSADLGSVSRAAREIRAKPSTALAQASYEIADAMLKARGQ